MWDVVVRLASRQHGVVARRDLLAAGCTSGQVAGWVRRGRLTTVARGVHVVAGAPTTPLADVAVAAARAGPGSRVVGERVLAALGVRDAEPRGPFVVLVPRGRVLTRVDFAWRADRWPGLGTSAVVDGVPSWSAPRNLLEVAVDEPDDEVLLRLSAGVRRVSRAWSSRVADVATGSDHPGARRLLLLGCLDADAVESTPERTLAALLAPHRPEQQVEVLPGVRVDLLLPRLRVVVEYDGRADHDGVAAVVADAERDRRLAAAGYVTLRVRHHDLLRPAHLLARLDALA